MKTDRRVPCSLEVGFGGVSPTEAADKAAVATWLLTASRALVCV